MINKACSNRRNGHPQIDAILTIIAAIQYPYLIVFTELYVEDSRSVTHLYIAISVAALLLSLSTALASYKSKTNYVLIVSSQLPRAIFKKL